MSHEIEQMFVFFSIFFIWSWTLSYINSNLAFYAKCSMISSNCLKMTGFSSRNVRYPRYQDTDWLQLCTAPRGLKFCTALILWSSRSTTIPRRVTHQHEAGQQPTQGWSPTNLRMVTQRRKCTTDMEFGPYTLLTKLKPGENCNG